MRSLVIKQFNLPNLPVRFTILFYMIRNFYRSNLPVFFKLIGSNHQAINRLIESCLPQFFPQYFFSLSSIKRKQTSYWTKQFFLSFNKNSSIQNSLFGDMILLKKLGKQDSINRLIPWWFDPMSLLIE